MSFLPGDNELNDITRNAIYRMISFFVPLNLTPLFHLISRRPLVFAVCHKDSTGKTIACER